MTAKSLRHALVSLLLLLPCFWTGRVHAGDLSSHSYNAWLTLVVERSPVEGLAVVRVWTNWVFDVLLTETIRFAGVAWAERIGASVCVLALFWGSFAFIAAITGVRPWRSAPIVAALAYGWLFHVGLMNYMLGLGLGLGAAALWLRLNGARRLAAIPLFALSLASHAFAFVPAAACAVWFAVAPRLRARMRRCILAAMVLLAGAARLGLSISGHVVANPGLPDVSGLGQFVVVSPDVSLAAVLVFVPLLIPVIAALEKEGLKQFATTPIGGFTLASMAVVALIPFGVSLPLYAIPITALGQRLSFLVVVGLLSFDALSAPPRAVTACSWLGVIAFFSCLWWHGRQFDTLEAQLRNVLLSAPEGSRVIWNVDSGTTRAGQFAHMIDRACIGHCWSYGNYEPSSQAFPLRAVTRNPVVISDADRQRSLEAGTFSVEAMDLPLHVVEYRAGRETPFTIREATAGETIAVQRVNPIRILRFPFAASPRSNETGAPSAK